MHHSLGHLLRTMTMLGSLRMIPSFFGFSFLFLAHPSNAACSRRREVDDIAQAQNLLAFTVLQDGIPVVYYGQEQHFSGGNDPDNREALWTSGYDTTSPLYTLIATSNKLRSHAISNDQEYVTYKVCIPS